MSDIRDVNNKHDIKSIEIFPFYLFVIYDNKVFEYLYPINHSNIIAYVSPMSFKANIGLFIAAHNFQLGKDLLQV